MIDDSDTEMMKVQVYYLRMDQPPQYPQSHSSDIAFRLLPKPISASYYLELYQGVVLNCNWLDRLVMSETELETVINQKQVHIYVVFAADDPCGFLELVEKPGYVEILYFGLFPEFVGSGKGLSVLRKSVETAWSYEPDWVQLNTCESKSPEGVHFFERVGFNVYQVKSEYRRSFRFRK